MHCGARQRARSQDVSVFKIVGSMHSTVIYTQDCIRNKPSALSHSDVHLMTYDVQLPAMMCNYTFYTYKINALINMIITYLYSPNGRAERARHQFILTTGARPPQAQTSRGVRSDDLFPLAEVVSLNYFMWQHTPRFIVLPCQ